MDNRIKELEELIGYHQEKYYNEQPEISDMAFDELVDELRKINPKSEILKNVGRKVKITGWKKEIHLMKMGSLNKVLLSDIDEIFIKANESKLVVMEKYDGISLELIYVDGELIKAITRGDGEEGENIFQNVLQMQNVKRHFNSFTGSLRAEIILSKKNFDKLNLLVDDSFSNPRNAASGIARAYDGKFCYLLELKYYDAFMLSENSLFFDNKYYSSKLNFLIDKIELVSPHDCYIINNKVDLLHIYKEYLGMRNALGYNIDGLVITIDDVDIQNQLGTINNRPKYAWALKFPASEKKTVLLNVDWNVTRTGRVNPRAHIEAVEIDGSIIQYATLHNLDYIQNLGLGIKDEVMVKKAGDIIPAITEVVVHKNNPIAIPKFCPACRSELEQDEKFLWCININCPAKRTEQIIHYCRTIEMDRVGPGLIEKIVEALSIWNIPSFYSISKEELLSIDGVGEIVANNFLKELKEKSSMTLQRFLMALSMDGLAEKNAGILANYIENNFGDIEKYLLSSQDVGIENLFTEQTVQKIKNSLHANIWIITQTLPYIQIIKKEKVSSKLQGKSFCITGALEFSKRDDYIKLIKENGGEYKNGVAKGLTYLVTNDTESGSSKNKKAKELGIEVINENKLREMLK